MPRAADWASRLDDADDIRPVLAAFFLEIHEVATIRGGSLGAFSGAADEQATKFRSVCQKTTKVRVAEWDELFASYGATYEAKCRKYARVCDETRRCLVNREKKQKSRRRAKI